MENIPWKQCGLQFFLHQNNPTFLIVLICLPKQDMPHAFHVHNYQHTLTLATLYLSHLLPLVFPLPFSSGDNLVK